MVWYLIALGLLMALIILMLTHVRLRRRFSDNIGGLGDYYSGIGQILLAVGAIAAGAWALYRFDALFIAEKARKEIESVAVNFEINHSVEGGRYLLLTVLVDNQGFGDLTINLTGNEMTVSKVISNGHDVLGAAAETRKPSYYEEIEFGKAAVRFPTRTVIAGTKKDLRYAVDLNSDAAGLYYVTFSTSFSQGATSEKIWFTSKYIYVD